MSKVQMTLEGVFQALEAASSQVDATERKLGEDQLKAWEIVPQFHEHLQVCLMQLKCYK